jgi:hypothetical protein
MRVSRNEIFCFGIENVGNKFSRSVLKKAPAYKTFFGEIYNCAR